MRILVTGGSGFIGTNLLAELQRQGHILVNIDRAPPRGPAQSIPQLSIDLCDRDRILNAFIEFRPDTVYHLGARTDLHGKTIADYAANIAGVGIIIDAIKECGTVRRAFFSSSRLVCRIGYQPTSDQDYLPSTPYGESKIEGERLVRGANLYCAWCIFRPTSIWGPWFGVPYKDFFMSIARGRYVHPRGVRIRKSFGYVGNTVHQLSALLNVSSERYHQKTFYLADRPIDVQEWAQLISTEIGRPRPRMVPLGLLKMIAGLGDISKGWGYREPPLTRFRLDNLLTDMVYDTRLIEDIAGPGPFQLSEGVRDTVAWLRSVNAI